MMICGGEGEGGARSRDRSVAHPLPCEKGRAIGPSHVLAHPPFPALSSPLKNLTYPL
jgi:hypothetical protein